MPGDFGFGRRFDCAPVSVRGPKLIEILEHTAPVFARLDYQIQVHGHNDARPLSTARPRDEGETSVPPSLDPIPKKKDD